MGKSATLRLPEIRQVFRLLGDCRDLGHDPHAWTMRAIVGFRDLTRSVMVAGGYYDLRRLPNSSDMDKSAWDNGWLTDRERATWLGYLDEGRHRNYPTVQRAMPLVLSSELTVFRREELVPDREWYGGFELEDRKSVGQDDTMLAHLRATNPSGLISFSLNRAVGEGRFSPRDSAMVRLFCEELQGPSDRFLVVDGKGPFDKLVPRLREVLEALSGGDTEKQVALRLGLSRHTVHDYVKRLYRQCGVGSRGELLAPYFRLGRKD